MKRIILFQSKLVVRTLIVPAPETITALSMVAGAAILSDIIVDVVVLGIKK